nr:helix-hairpin-helix domain-containing protein [Planococcus salinarum]
MNINTADDTGLTTLPGIGPSKAAAIIAHREENGPFVSIEALKDVTGIAIKRLNN